MTTSSHDPKVRTEALALADELGLPFVSPGDECPDRAHLLLVLGDNGLSLCETGRRAPGPIRVDFTRQLGPFPRTATESRRQPIARALGLRHGYTSILDATAGLARDSFLIARLGCSIRMIERNVILGALIRDGLRRAAASDSADLCQIVGRMVLSVGDARDILQALADTERPDVIYIDPMFPPKAAMAKKEMRLCRRLVGDDEDADALLTAARDVALRRVVVKRHRRARSLTPAPSLRCLGKQVRYDVYLTGR